MSDEADLLQEPQEELVYMSTLQEQNQDLSGPHSVCGQAPIPGVGIHEYCSKDIYEKIRRDGPIGWRNG